MSRSPTCWRNTPGAIPRKTAIVDLESGTAIDFGQLDRDRHRHRRLSQEQGHPQGQPRPGAVGRMPGKAADLVRRLADRRGDLPVQSRDQRKADGHADRRAEACADPLSQGHRRRRDGRRRAGRARPLRRVVAGRRERPAGRAVRGAAARRRGATARAERRRRHRLHLLHLGHHGAAEDRHLQPRRLLDERPRHAGIPRPHRGRPHPGIPLVRLELGAGVEPAAVPAEGADHAHRQAVLAQPLLRMDAATRNHVFGGRADGAQHPAEQADRLHREGRADACG